MGFKWHILGDGSFARKQGRRRKGNPLSHVSLSDGTRSGEREDGDETILDILSPHYLALSVNYYPPSITESPFACSRYTSLVKLTLLADYVLESSDIPCADTPRATKEREKVK